MPAASEKNNNTQNNWGDGRVDSNNTAGQPINERTETMKLHKAAGSR